MWRKADPASLLRKSVHREAHLSRTRPQFIPRGISPEQDERVQPQAQLELAQLELAYCKCE
jgi:hypothetical protein